VSEKMLVTTGRPQQPISSKLQPAVHRSQGAGHLSHSGARLLALRLNLGQHRIDAE